MVNTKPISPIWQEKTDCCYSHTDRPYRRRARMFYLLENLFLKTGSGEFHNQFDVIVVKGIINGGSVSMINH